MKKTLIILVLFLSLLSACGNIQTTPVLFTVKDTTCLMIPIRVNKIYIFSHIYRAKVVYQDGTEHSLHVSSSDCYQLKNNESVLLWKADASDTNLYNVEPAE